MILCDTGPLVSAALLDDADHVACVGLLTRLHEARRRLLVPATVVAEVGYLLAREGGAAVEAAFLRSFADGAFEVADLTPTDLARAGDLVEQYADFPLGTTDATVVALAERLDLVEVATLDRRHFAAVRPSHVLALTLVP